MNLFHQVAMFAHIAIGSCALIVFWIPVFTRKGNLNHKRFGRYFAWAMYAVSFSGIAMAGLDLLFPVAMHAPDMILTPDEELRVNAQVRPFALFLLSLSILVLTSTRHGWLAILHKEERNALRQPAHIALCSSLVAVGAVLLVTGLNMGSWLFMIFGVLEVFTGFNMLRYVFRTTLRPREWWIQHLTGLIGSGIGAYTAFAVFGGRSLFDELFGNSFSDITIVLWVAPGVIGGIAIALLSRKYQQRFGGDWITQRAVLRSRLFS